MNKRIKKQWVELLRSGEFEQGRGHLEQDNKFCCLGVLCQIALVEGACEFEVIQSVNSANIKYNRYDSHHVDETLSPHLLEWADLPAVDMDVLIELNDEHRASFQEIADYIEKSL